MDIGELFWIERPNGNLEEKVLRAAQSYQKKYGQAPTLCLVNPGLLNGRKRLGRLRLEGRKSVLPNYLWIGVAGETTTPLAG